MTNTTRAVRGGLLAALVLLPLASSAPAQATFPDNWLYVTVARGDARFGDARFADARGSLLLCDPPQGHTRAAEACAELRAAGGDITRIPHKDGMCAQVYAPIRATARGEWNGRPVEYEQTFANGCVMTARTGSVFALPD